MAWKRNEMDAPPETPTRGVREPSPRSDRPPARLGPSVTIRGDLAGEEDLLIEGQLEGEVVVRQHSVTVGRSGRVRADVYGKRVVVEGEVAGSLYGVEEVVIRKAGKVEGSAVSPRVTLESGANFRGQIDMNADSVAQAFHRAAPAALANQVARPPSARTPERPNRHSCRSGRGSWRHSPE